MKRSISNRLVINTLGIALFVVLWEVVSLMVGERTFIFPGPLETCKEMIRMLKGSYVYDCIFLTMIRMIGGFAIAFALALILGILAGNNPFLEQLMRPTISMLRSIPTACLVYLFLVIIGARMTPMYIVILIAFPILYESVASGIRNVPEEVLEAAAVDGAGYLATTFSIKLPMAVPYIATGLISTFGLSLKIEIMAEVLTGYTKSGLGSAILAAQRSDPTNMVPVFAYGLIVIILVMLCDFIALLANHQRHN